MSNHQPNDSDQKTEFFITESQLRLLLQLVDDHCGAEQRVSANPAAAACHGLDPRGLHDGGVCAAQKLAEFILTNTVVWGVDVTLVRGRHTSFETSQPHRGQAETEFAAECEKFAGELLQGGSLIVSVRRDG